MTYTLADLLLLAIPAALGVVVAALVYRRWGLAPALAVLGAVATMLGLSQLRRLLEPLPERPRPPVLLPPLPEAEIEAKAVADHEAHVEEMRKAQSIPNKDERREALGKLMKGQWGDGP